MPDATENNLVMTQVKDESGKVVRTEIESLCDEHLNCYRKHAGESQAITVSKRKTRRACFDC